jgi:curli biogenesis system outer membrane secretion channel CsgG
MTKGSATMRLTPLLMIAAACAMLATGCQAIDGILNPMPTAQGSRVELSGLPQPNPENKRVVTVYRFDNRTGFPAGLAISNGMTDMLINTLVQTGHFRVVEREQLDTILTEKRLQSSGMASGEAAKTKILGAALIIKGSVTELNETGGGGLSASQWGLSAGVRTRTANVGLDLRVFDAATSEVLGTVDQRKTVRKAGMRAGYGGVAGDVELSNAMDLAIREVIDAAIVELVTKYGSHLQK